MNDLPKASAENPHVLHKTAALLQRINARLGKIETGVLCMIIAMMLGLALLKIVLRYGFQTSLMGSDAMLQHLTLWLCFFGAALATCERRHISIDILNRILPETITRWSSLIVDCLALIVVGILAYYGFDFLIDEQSSEAVLIGNIPLWWAKSIIPVGFVLIGLHLALQIGIQLINSGGVPPVNKGVPE